MAALKSPGRFTAGAMETPDAPLQVNVIFTEVASTLASLRRAAALAGDLNARIRLIVPSIVPYPLPLNEPPVAFGHARRRFRTLARRTGVETYVEICYGRETGDILDCVLRSHSVVVIGGRRRWWSSSTQRCAKRLEDAGHRVIFVEAGGGRA